VTNTGVPGLKDVPKYLSAVIGTAYIKHLVVTPRATEKLDVFREILPTKERNFTEMNDVEMHLSNFGT
jgi:hypothetical protein